MTYTRDAAVGNTRCSSGRGVAAAITVITSSGGATVNDACGTRHIADARSSGRETRSPGVAVAVVALLPQRINFHAIDWGKNHPYERKLIACCGIIRL